MYSKPKFFPAKSMVHIDPDDPKVFDKIREISNSDLYLERLPFILEAKELTLKKYNIFARLAAHFNEAATQKPMPPEKITLQPANLDWNANERGCVASSIKQGHSLHAEPYCVPIKVRWLQGNFF